MKHFDRRLRSRRPLLQSLVLALLLASIVGAWLVPSSALAATTYVVYGDALTGGWQNWSWDSTINLSASSPVRSGSHSLAFTYNKAWAGLYLHTGGISTTGYSSLQFYLNGGTASGQLVDVVLYDANLRQIPSPQPINKYIAGGSIAAGQWRLVSVPLGDLKGTNTVVSGVVIQDMSGHAQPTIYLTNLQLVPSASPAPTSTPVATSIPVATRTSVPAPTNTPVSAPTNTPVPPPTSGSSAITGSQPFTSVPNHPNEYNEAKGALQWMPQIKRAVGDAVAAGLLRPDERQLFENVLLGMVGVESTGKVFIVGNASSQWYSQGLTQLVYANTYKEEDPFDPMTNLHDALRAVIRYYRKWGNRWDRAVAQHVTGAEDENTQRYQRDWNGTDGQDYAERVVNIVWQAAQLEHSGDLYSAHSNAYQASCGTCWYDHAAWWSIWDSPNLTYTWTPPSNSTAYSYVQSGVDGNVKQPIATNTWMSVPSWFYSTSPASNVAPFSPRQPSAAEAQGYPVGRTADSPWGDTYPRRTWSTSNP